MCQDTPALTRRWLGSTAAALLLGAVMFTVGAIGLAPEGNTSARRAGGTSEHPAPDRGVDALRARVDRLPRDAGAWAALGIAHLEQARVTADPAAHDRAESALRRSLTVQPDGNTAAETGLGALAAARHDFPTALTWARKATTGDPYNPAAHGVLADARTQLGQYEAADRAVQRMNDLNPDSSALARASYALELRGDTTRARSLMRRALTAAATPGERSFARGTLSALALQEGDAPQALEQARAGLRTDPGDPALLEAEARAHTALGRTRQAIRAYEAALAVAPLPHYLLGLGELQQSLGRQDRAEEQYALLRAQETMRRSGGEPGSGPADTDAILFEADHGRPDQAVAMAAEALRTRPFIAVHDAQAWALHRAGREDEALDHADRALALGTRSALFHYHRAVIHHALGNTAAARRDLTTALGTEPRFHPLHAPVARALLRRIDHTP
ncbi:tetratricopeptide repeat protein [Streptomyces uncialis]|uniref:tetratricopeptide repeat protein n=1 Tax=Streptomyces uncialis TaxID=1048205 RepID=UPI002256CD6B|nr:tetratricopeptide repeat protein [Streptomyces uncialis]MCX4659080.1 tetratricopeptide repeat protein [Streptomyces uncialis]